MKAHLAVAACLLIVSPAAAQSVGEKTGVNSALSVTPSTTDFVKQAASSDMFEIQSSQQTCDPCRLDRAWVGTAGAIGPIWSLL